MLFIKKVSVKIKNKNILNNINLKILPGEIHAIMGPNGSGKSTLASIIAGNKKYKIKKGSIYFKSINLSKINISDRAKMGIFLSFQNPIEIPGINNLFFLKTCINSIRKYKKLPLLEDYKFNKIVKKKINLLKISKKLLNRSVNTNFSGGEKKINDILQMMMLKPKLCILDEIDSGLDIDTLKNVFKNINLFQNKKRSFIIITHYQKIFEYIKPNYIHIFYKGSIIKSGNFSLAKKIEKNGYEYFTKKKKL